MIEIIIKVDLTYIGVHYTIFRLTKNCFYFFIHPKLIFLDAADVLIVAAVVKVSADFLNCHLFCHRESYRLMPVFHVELYHVRRVFE